MKRLHFKHMNSRQKQSANSANSVILVNQLAHQDYGQQMLKNASNELITEMFPG